MTAKEIIESYMGKVIKLSFSTGFIFCDRVDGDIFDLLKRADEVYKDMARDAHYRASTYITFAKDRIAKLPGEIKLLENKLAQYETELEEVKAEIDDAPKYLHDELRARINKLRYEIKELKGYTKNDKKIIGSIALKKKILKELTERKLPYCERKVQSIKKYLDNYTPFAERELVEDYPSIDRTDIEKIDRIIICEGAESGDYWTVKEYREDTERKY